MKRELYLVGGGGHCRSCIDVIESEGNYQICGVVDVHERLNEEVLGYPIVATDHDIERLALGGCGFFVTIGQISSSAARVNLFSLLQDLGAFLPCVVSPFAHVSRHAALGEGTIVMHGATVNAGASVGINCILNSHCLVEHDATISDHCHISTGAIINGECIIGPRTFIGSNSVIAHGVTVASEIVVGAGSVLIQNISEPGVYVGNPCKRIR